MIDSKAAYDIARSLQPENGYTLNPQPERVNEGWLFSWDGVDEAGLIIPGGPDLVLVHGDSGAVERIFLPSERGFEVIGTSQ